MRAGKLRHRVTIQQRLAGSPQRTPTGAPDTSWSDVATVWASIDTLRGRELIEAQAVQSRLEVRIRLRYRAGLTAAMRIVHGTDIYNIEAVIDREQQHVELELMCSRGSNNG